MPTYDYICDACNHEFEAFQSMTADLLTDCPECHKPQLRRKIGTGMGIVFKGSGFYETDYKRGDNYQKAASQDKPESKEKKKDSSNKKSTHSTEAKS